MCRFEFVGSAPTQHASPAGRQARPTKLDRSKCDSLRCASAKASQLSVARRLTAPTVLITANSRMCRCTPASSESWRCARAIASLAAMGPWQPVQTARR